MLYLNPHWMQNDREVIQFHSSMGSVVVWTRWRPFGVDSVRLGGSKKRLCYFFINF